MSIHKLNPRLPGNPDVFCVKIGDGSWRCYQSAPPGSDAVAQRIGEGKTEAKALAAARKRAPNE